MFYHIKYNIWIKNSKICARKIWSAVQLTNLTCERCFVCLSVLNALTQSSTPAYFPSVRVKKGGEKALKLLESHKKLLIKKYITST